MDERKQQPQVIVLTLWLSERSAQIGLRYPLGTTRSIPPPAETPKHDSKEFQFASDSLEGADGYITKWREETLLLLQDHLLLDHSI